MPVSVECPSCEQVFRVSNKYRGRKGRCPHCDRSFVADDSVLVADASTPQDKTETDESSTATGLPLPRQLKSRLPATGSRAPNSAPMAPPPSPLSHTSDLAEDEISFTTDALGRLEQEQAAEESSSFEDEAASKTGGERTPSSERPMKNSTLVLLALGLVFVSSTVAFGVAELLQPRFFLSGGPADEDADSNRASASDNARPRQQNQPASGAEPRSRVQADEQPQFLSMDQLFDAWSVLNAYLIQLDVQTADGLRPVTGVVIDSRGWVLTSYHAIRGATSIEARPASLSMVDGEPVSDLADDIDGVLAVDPDRDLAVVAINRRLVRSVADLRLDTENTVVGSQRLRICRVPRPDRRLWITDVRVIGRPTDKQLGDNGLQQLMQLGYRSKPFEQWIQLDLKPELGPPGTALFDDRLGLVGMVVSHPSPSSESGEPLPWRLATDSSSIRDLLSNCDPGKMLPLRQAFDSPAIVFQSPQRQGPSLAAAQPAQDSPASAPGPTEVPDPFSKSQGGAAGPDADAGNSPLDTDTVPSQQKSPRIHWQSNSTHSPRTFSKSSPCSSLRNPATSWIGQPQMLRPSAVLDRSANRF